MESIVLGAGCFWCTEAVFRELRGVENVTVGYAGGTSKDPTYEEVSYRNTGHVEVAKVEYNPEEVTLEELLEVYFYTHDPTTLNKQGADVGEQYRSVIFYSDDTQKTKAEEALEKVNKSGNYPGPVVTTIEPLETFYKAEVSHQEYYANNPDAQYCKVVIDPKVAKLRKQFTDKLKK